MIATPIWPEFILPALQVMSDGVVRQNRELRVACFEQMGLSPEVLSETLPSGESRAHNRAGWAITYVHRANWLERVSRGSYQITDEGRQALVTHADGFHDYASASRVLDKYWVPVVKPAPSVIEQSPMTELPPTEQIESVIAGIEASVAEDLLTRLRNAHPDFFEEAVVKVLLAMGYGGSQQRGRRIGGTGDGGVDGVIDQDALGLDQIYVQAKRYHEGNNVGRETIQAFIGALHGFGASRGVFITSSDFTSGAVEYARQVPTRVVLINGQRLAQLMIKHRVGVQVTRTYAVVDLDEDFFE